MRLEKIDLSKAHKHEHALIKTNLGSTYLIKKSYRWYCGFFNQQWFGLNFTDGFHQFQFDAPGFNGSDWKEVYEVIED